MGGVTPFHVTFSQVSGYKNLVHMANSGLFFSSQECLEVSASSSKFWQILQSFGKFSTMESFISTQSPNSDELGTALREAGLSKELVAQLVHFQPPVVPLLPNRQEQNLSRQQTSQGQGPSTAAERTHAQTETEQSSNPPDPQFQTRVMSLLSSMERRLAAMESRSEALATVESWADRSLEGGEVTGGLNDPNLTLQGARSSTSEDPEEVSETTTLVEVSEETAQVVNSAFKTPLANTARQALRRQFGVPKLDTTKCPKLDTVIKCNLSKEVKDADSQLARIHTLMLDAVAPLVQVLEEAASNTLTTESATKAAKTALNLIGNASCQMAKDRRKKVLKELNKDLQPLAEEEGTFAEAAPSFSAMDLRNK